MTRVPGHGPLPARWMLIGEAPGGDEEAYHENGIPSPRPFVGVSGRLLDGVLSSVGLPRSAAYVTNVVKYRPPKNKIEEWLTDNGAKAERNGLAHASNGRHYNDAVKEGMAELFREIEAARPEVIVALGNTPLWALTGEWGITRWRGSELWYGDSRLIPVLHPAAILRDMGQRPNLVHDLRTRVMGKMHDPSLGREPTWKFRTGRDLNSTAASLQEILWNLDSGPHPLSIDIETRKGRIDCVGIAWSARDAISVPVTDSTLNEVWTDGEWREIGGLLRAVLTHPNAHIIGQNFNYDAQFFERDEAFAYRVVCAHDTKVAQHVLLPGTDKDLVTLSAAYCDWHCYWKDDLKEASATLDDERRWRYNCRDCVVTYEVAMKQLPLLKKARFL